MDLERREALGHGHELDRVDVDVGRDVGRPVHRLRDVVGGHDDYKKVPRGFDADHPRAELLKLRGLTGSFPEIPAGLIGKPGFADWLIKHAKAMAPLVIWLHRHVG